MKKLLRSLLVAVASCSIAATTLVVGSAASAQAAIEVRDSDCSDVTVLGLRGSDRYEQDLLNVGRKDATAIDSLGTFNRKLANNISGDLNDDATIKYIAIPYNFGMSVSPSSFADADKYRRNMKAATDLTSAAVSNALSACPSTKLVILGTDTGAQVAHEYLSLAPDVAIKNIAAVVLIGNLVYDSSDKNQKSYNGQGEAPFTGKGMMLDPVRQAPGITSADYLKKEAPEHPAVAPTMAGRVMNICANYDWSCFGPSGDGVRSQNAFPQYLTAKYIAEPAQWVASKITAICPDVTFFAARGSGELRGSGTPVQPEGKVQGFKPGFGTPLASLAFAIEQKYQKGEPTTFGHVAVSYVAISVGDAMALWSGYPASVQSGIKSNNGPQQFRDIISACPATRVVMLGYSQGGHVIHEILLQLTAAERAHIAATVLVADAIRNPNDGNAVTFMGNSVAVEAKGSIIFDGMGLMRMVAKADTVCLAQNKLADEQRGEDFFYFLKDPIKTIVFCAVMPFAPRLSDVVSPQTYPSDMGGKMLNVCSSLDLICDAKEPLDSAGQINYSNLSLDITYKLLVDEVHGDGYNHPEFYDFSAGWAYHQIHEVVMSGSSR